MIYILRRRPTISLHMSFVFHIFSLTLLTPLRQEIKSFRKQIVGEIEKEGNGEGKGKIERGEKIGGGEN